MPSVSWPGYTRNALIAVLVSVIDDPSGAKETQEALEHESCPAQEYALGCLKYHCMPGTCAGGGAALPREGTLPMSTLFGPQGPVWKVRALKLRDAAAGGGVRVVGGGEAGGGGDGEIGRGGDGD